MQALIVVNEIFGETIQGEGKSTGLRVMFLRLAKCNLSCIFCDTPYTWNWINTNFKHPIKYEREKEMHTMSSEQIFSEILKLDTRHCKALVISGGEPLLQQKQLLPLILQLKAHNYFIEVETNGTIGISEQFYSLVDQFNCSPKLANSHDSKKQRVRPKVLKQLAQSEKVYFKFVVEKEKDIVDVLEYVYNYGIKKEKVYLMPMGTTRTELNETRQLTKKLAQKYQFSFTNRLHIENWDNIRGV